MDFLRLFFFLLLLNLGANAQSEYSFVVAGHAYGAPGVDNKGFHPPFAKKYKQLWKEGYEFAVLTGDIVLKPTTGNWDEVDSVLREAQIPTYFAPGNHDLGDRPLYEKRYGRTYFCKSTEYDLFVFWEVSSSGWNVPKQQITMLDSAVRAMDSLRNVFVFCSSSNLVGKRDGPHYR